MLEKLHRVDLLQFRDTKEITTHTQKQAGRQNNKVQIGKRRFNSSYAQAAYGSMDKN
uniref:Uncharacterized protein n=1 Tax=Arundo donax TaxID=35708 RepID=A0A0A8YFS8_ARUDO